MIMSTSDPGFCCIVMSYNSSSTVLETLNSVINQSVRPHQLIITDDFSTDSSREIIRQWYKCNASSFSVISCLFPDSRKGTNNILSMALDCVVEPFVKAVAGDDILCSTFFQEAILIFDSSDPDVIIPDVRFIDISGALIPAKNISLFSRFSFLFFLDRVVQRYFILFDMFIPSVGAIFKTDVLRAVRQPQFYLIEDWPMWINLLWGDFRIYFSSLLSIQYRIHASQVTQKNEDPQTASWIKSDLNNKDIYLLNILSQAHIMFRLFFYFDSICSRLLRRFLQIFGVHVPVRTRLSIHVVSFIGRILCRFVNFKSLIAGKVLR